MRKFLTALTLVVAGFLSQPSIADTPGFAKNVFELEKLYPAPDFPLSFADGRTGSIADYKGEVLVVTVWQEHCPFCRKEMPRLNRLSQEMAGEGVRVVALGLDQDMGLIQSYLDQHSYGSIEPILDQDKMNGTLLAMAYFPDFSIRPDGSVGIATPTSFIVDKSGAVVAKVWGLVDWDGADARGYLRALAAG